MSRSPLVYLFVAFNAGKISLLKSLELLQLRHFFFRNRKRSEILSFSSSWKDRKNESDAIFDILEQNLQILLHCRIDKNGQYPLKEFPEEWLRFAEYAPLEKFAGLSDKIREARKQNAFNVNFQAIIEQLLLTFIGESELWVQ